MAAVEIAGPGFLNITVDAGAQGQVASDVVAAGASYGGSDVFAGNRINLEFVSANPTGPLHLGDTRWAAVGDALGRILQAAGAEVTREFYFNDHGNQIDRFGASLEAAALGKPIPEDGYGGEYIARHRRPDHGRPAGDRRPARRRATGRLPRGRRTRFSSRTSRTSSHDFNVDFDVYFHERSLHEDTVARLRDRTLKGLRTRGTSREGRCPLAAHREVRRRQGPGDHQVRRQGAPTCPVTWPTTSTSGSAASTDASIMLGADHHGYVGADDGDVRGVRRRPARQPRDPHRPDGQPARTVAAADVEAGRHRRHDRRPRRRDRRRRAAATPWPATAATARSTSTWTCGPKASNDNPVYYVQYAHARVPD